MRLDDGSSVAICVPPASPSVAITVRRFGKRSSSAAQLVEQGALPANVLLTRRRSPSVLILALVFLDGQNYHSVSNPATNL